jgi:hypothetical protein
MFEQPRSAELAEDCWISARSLRTRSCLRLFHDDYLTSRIRPAGVAGMTIGIIGRRLSKNVLDRIACRRGPHVVCAARQLHTRPDVGS